MEFLPTLGIAHEHTTKYGHNASTVGEWLAQSPNPVQYNMALRSSKMYSLRHRSITLMNRLPLCTMPAVIRLSILGIHVNRWTAIITHEKNYGSHRLHFGILPIGVGLILY